MSQRDLQSDIGVIATETLGPVTTTATNLGTAIDTLNMRKWACIVTPDVTLGSDVVRFVVHESDTVAGTYTAVSEDKILPTRNYDEDGQIIVDAESPYEQTFGAIDTKRFIKVGVFNAATITVANFDMTVIFNPLTQPFTAYDPNLVAFTRP